MTAPSFALLPDRGIVRVAGAEAAKLLQGLVTNDIDLLGRRPAIHAGLLTPQGKILFEFFIARDSDGYLLETAADATSGLARRLTLYKLRSNVVIENQGAKWRVAALWGGAGAVDGAVVSFEDPRLPALGSRLYLAQGSDDGALNGAGQSVNAADYHAHRIGLGAPEGGKDYPLGDAFPHEALFDQLNGVSFTKGCFVGQEVVSRMEHRGTARKRVVMVTGSAELPTSGNEVRAGDVALGRLGSTAGSRGLALLRLDRVAEALDKGATVEAGGVALTVSIPPFARFDLRPQGASMA